MIVNQRHRSQGYIARIGDGVAVSDDIARHGIRQDRRRFNHINCRGADTLNRDRHGLRRLHFGRRNHGHVGDATCVHVCLGHVIRCSAGKKFTRSQTQGGHRRAVDRRDFVIHHDRRRKKRNITGIGHNIAVVQNITDAVKIRHQRLFGHRQFRLLRRAFGKHVAAVGQCWRTRIGWLCGGGGSVDKARKKTGCRAKLTVKIGLRHKISKTATAVLGTRGQSANGAGAGHQIIRYGRGCQTNIAGIAHCDHKRHGLPQQGKRIIRAGRRGDCFGHVNLRGSRGKRVCYRSQTRNRAALRV